MYIASLLASLIGVILFGRNIWARGAGSSCQQADIFNVGVGEADPDSGGGEVLCGFA